MLSNMGSYKVLFNDLCGQLLYYLYDSINHLSSLLNAVEFQADNICIQLSIELNYIIDSALCSYHLHCAPGQFAVVRLMYRAMFSFAQKIANPGVQILYWD